MFQFDHEMDLIDKFHKDDPDIEKTPEKIKAALALARAKQELWYNIIITSIFFSLPLIIRVAKYFALLSRANISDHTVPTAW